MQVQGVMKWVSSKKVGNWEPKVGWQEAVGLLDTVVMRTERIFFRIAEAACMLYDTMYGMSCAPQEALGRLSNQRLLELSESGGALAPSGRGYVTSLLPDGLVKKARSLCWFVVWCSVLYCFVLYLVVGVLCYSVFGNVELRCMWWHVQLARAACDGHGRGVGCSRGHVLNACAAVRNSRTYLCPATHVTVWCSACGWLRLIQEWAGICWTCYMST